MYVPFLFKHDADGRAIPEFNSGHDWVLNRASGVFLTVKIDGVTVRLARYGNGNKLTLLKQSWTDHHDTWTMCHETVPEDALLFEAVKNSAAISEGIYVAYGPGIKGNPQKVDRLYTVRVSPADGFLIMYSGSGVKRLGATVQSFYDDCRVALRDGDAEGMVIQLEEPTMTLKSAVQVTRQEFGFVWPLPDPPMTPSQAVGQLYRGH